MKITERQVRKLIQEEVSRILNEEFNADTDPVVQDMLVDAGFSPDGREETSGNMPGPNGWQLYSPESVEEASSWIQAAIDMNAALRKADEELMFDINGNIATNNSTHFFYVKNNSVYTSVGKYCVRGITRQKVLYICKRNKIKVYEKNFKLNDVLKSDEAFVTGTFANIIPVKKINNKKFNIKNNIITERIRKLYLELMDK